MNSKTKNITITGMGITLFVVLTLCLQVPVFENYYLCLGYIVMSIYLYSFGVINGTIVGVVGVVIYCLLIGGLNGLPGWSVGNIAIGVILGLTFKMTKKMKNIVLENMLNVLSIIISTAIGMLVIKSSIECLLYAQPFWVRTSNNIFAFVADVVVLMAALPICKIVDPLIRKIISENKHEK